jgi:hypothetical protein
MHRSLRLHHSPLQLEQLRREFDTGVTYPSYYLQPFHAYDQVGLPLPSGCSAADGIDAAGPHHGICPASLVHPTKH